MFFDFVNVVHDVNFTCLYFDSFMAKLHHHPKTVPHYN